MWWRSTAGWSVWESSCQMRARAGGLIDDDPRVRSFITLAVLVAALTLAAGASGRPVRRPVRSPRSVTLEWVGDMAISTERGLPPGGLDRGVGAGRA